MQTVVASVARFGRRSNEMLLARRAYGRRRLGAANLAPFRLLAGVRLAVPSGMHLAPAGLRHAYSTEASLAASDTTADASTVPAAAAATAIPAGGVYVSTHYRLQADEIPTFLQRVGLEYRVNNGFVEVKNCSMCRAAKVRFHPARGLPHLSRS